MQIKKTHLTKKVAIVFLCTMLFFTFFSKTIHYYLTPKVAIHKVESGYIKNNFTFNNISFDLSNSVAVSIPFKTKIQLQVKKVLKELLSDVSKGDAVLYFDNTGFDELVKTAQRTIKNIEISLVEFDKSFSDKVSQFEKSIADYSMQLENLVNSIASRYAEKPDPKMVDEYKNTRSELQYKLIDASDNLEYLKSSGILNGKTRNLIKEDLAEKKKELEMLQLLTENNFTLTAPITGRIVDIDIDENEKCSEGSIMMHILPQATPLRLKAPLHDTTLLEKLKNGALCTVKDGQQEIEATISEIIEEKGIHYVLVELRQEDDMSFQTLQTARISIETKSELCDKIIPNTAMVSQDKVFIVEMRNGFWGDEYYLREISITVGESDLYNSQITGGLSRNNIVVTGWDRALQDGATVILPLED